MGLVIKVEFCTLKIDFWIIDMALKIITHGTAKCYSLVLYDFVK